MPIIAAGIVTAGALIGQNRQSKSASASRGMQRQMAQKKYQWMMNDMKQAGLNPMLAAQGGSPGPAGASSPMIGYSNPLGEGVSTGLQAGKQAAEVKKLTEEAKKIAIEYAKIFVEVGIMDQQKRESIAREALIKIQKDFQALGLPKARWESYKYDNLLKGIKTIVNWNTREITEDRQEQGIKMGPGGKYEPDSAYPNYGVFP